MGTKHVILIVEKPGGTRVSGARVFCHNQSTIHKEFREWYGGTDKDGLFDIQNLENGWGDKYDFDAQFVDEAGVEWRGTTSDRIKNDTEKKIILHIAYPDEIGKINIPRQISEDLQKDEDGKILLNAISELQSAIRNRMTHATLVLSTYIIEGMIRIVAKRKGIWNPEFEDKTYGQLIHCKELEILFDKRLLEKARGLNAFRIGGAHFTGLQSFMAEGQVAIVIVQTLLPSWFPFHAVQPESLNKEQPPTTNSKVDHT